MAINSSICSHFFHFCLTVTGVFSRNIGMLFSELKLVTDDLLFIYAVANWEATESLHVWDKNLRNSTPLLVWLHLKCCVTELLLRACRAHAILYKRQIQCSRVCMKCLKIPTPLWRYSATCMNTVVQLKYSRTYILELQLLQFLIVLPNIKNNILLCIKSAFVYKCTL